MGYAFILTCFLFSLLRSPCSPTASTNMFAIYLVSLLPVPYSLNLSYFPQPIEINQEAETIINHPKLIHL